MHYLNSCKVNKISNIYIYISQSFIKCNVLALNSAFLKILTLI